MSIQVNDKNLGHATAYAYAVAGGYTGTEAEFTELLGNIADDLGQIENLTVTVETLAAGSSATASYSNGVLHLGIPKGDKGDGAYHVEPSGESFVIHTDADGIVTSAQEIRISINAKQGTSAMVISSVTGLPNISLAGGGNIAPEILKNAFTGSVATIIYTIPANSQITAEQINAQYIARVNNGTPNGYGISCSLSVAVVKDGAKGDTGATGSTGPTGNGIASVAKTGTSGLVDTYTITYTNGNTSTFTVTNGAEAVDNTLTIAGRAADAKKTGDEISELKEDFTQMESDGVVPSAEQILSDKGVTDSVPYHYRKTGGDGADRLYDQIVGGSLAVNQLVPDLGTLTSSGSKAFNNGTAKIAGHKYLFSANISADGDTVGLYSKADDVGTTEIILNYSAQSAIISAKKTATSDGTNNNSNGNMWLYPYISNGSISNIMFIDLTAMFGTTIADYIYSLEQSTAGAGVAFFKSLFPNDYYPYNACELVSVSGLSAHKMVGFNQWDEKWEVGGFVWTTGEPYSSKDRIRSKNFCRVLPSTAYYVKGGATIFWYEEDYTFIKYDGASATGNVLQSPANAKWFKILRQDAVIYNHDICINLSDPAKNGTYEPYKAHSYPLDSDVTLRGIPKLDANNQLYYDGDTYAADGTVTRKYGIVDLGTLTWSYFNLEGHKRFGAPFSSKSSSRNLICAKYQDVGYSAVFNNTVEGIAIHTDGTQVVVYDSAYTDAANFKTAMSGVYLVYELATPTTESADPYQHLQQCDPNGTEEYVSTGIVPVGHNSFYPENLRAKVEQLPWNFASLIAPTESTFVATRNYTTGSLFIVNNVLYKATSNIANGGTITPDTNCTATTLAEIISALA